MIGEKTDLAIILGTNVRFYRKSKSISQEKLAEAVGITSQYVSNIECGVSFPSVTKIQAIADVLNVPAYMLFLPEVISVGENENMISKKILSKKLKTAMEESIEAFIESI